MRPNPFLIHLQTYVHWESTQDPVEKQIVVEKRDPFLYIQTSVGLGQIMAEKVEQKPRSKSLKQLFLLPPSTPFFLALLLAKFCLYPFIRKGKLIEQWQTTTRSSFAWRARKSFEVNLAPFCLNFLPCINHHKLG